MKVNGTAVSYAKGFQCEDFIEYVKEFDKHFETAKLEDEGVMDFIDRYSEYVRSDDELL